MVMKISLFWDKVFVVFVAHTGKKINAYILYFTDKPTCRLRLICILNTQNLYPYIKKADNKSNFSLFHRWYCYRFNAFHAESKKPLHRECGFIRMQPGTNRVAFIIAQNSGMSLFFFIVTAQGVMEFLEYFAVCGKLGIMTICFPEI